MQLSPREPARHPALAAPGANSATEPAPVPDMDSVSQAVRCISSPLSALRALLHHQNAHRGPRRGVTCSMHARWVQQQRTLISSLDHSSGSAS